MAGEFVEGEMVAKASGVKTTVLVSRGGVVTMMI
jgi:hypothetical protein